MHKEHPPDYAVTTSPVQLAINIEDNYPRIHTGLSTGTLTTLFRTLPATLDPAHATPPLCQHPELTYETYRKHTNATKHYVYTLSINGRKRDETTPIYEQIERYLNLEEKYHLSQLTDPPLTPGTVKEIQTAYGNPRTFIYTKLSETPTLAQGLNTLEALPELPDDFFTRYKTRLNNSNPDPELWRTTHSCPNCNALTQTIAPYPYDEQPHSHNIKDYLYCWNCKTRSPPTIFIGETPRLSNYLQNKQ